MTSTLFDYMKQTQRFLRDTKQELLDPGDVISYVNQARREVAMRSQCIRVLPPISGSIQSATVTNGGSGYTSPTVVISSPDQASGRLPFPSGAQATGTAVVFGGVIAGVQISYGGDGYFQPTITITDPTGTGATVVPVVSPIMTLNPSQEEYRFLDIPLGNFPGVESVYTIRSVSVLYTNYRYSIPIYSFTYYQGVVRQYTVNSYQYIPCYGAQFGRGANGSFFLYPPPTQTFQLEFDCSCLPQDLLDDQSVEAIPQPWDDLVPYYAAHLCYLELQNYNAARFYIEQFNERMSRFGSYVDKGRAINVLGRP